MAAMRVVLSHLPLALLVLQTNFLPSKGSDSEFSYDPCSSLGPQNWGSLNYPAWEKCAAGEKQSPISITPSNIVKRSLGLLRLDHTEQHATLLNQGHDIMVNWTTPPEYIRINGKQFFLRQCHWHSPSEHEIYGKRYPLELHMVYSTDDSEIAVIGVLYELGVFQDPFLSKLEKDLNELKSKNKVDLGSISPPSPDYGPYFRYTGSLTTPPCSEPVIWTVMTQVRNVTEKQLALLRAPVGNKDNARPVQPINQRWVYYSDQFSRTEEYSSI